ncbi:transcriptional regulator [Microtetraspora sp. NBRC 13810]|uniref:helix-turn-helix transcriptional regulator n=1 Tax=Microtetraspora sp. NBRC 13810 TaxID=3030990 RepID=UPI0024A29474|nr:YafY family protein [Microtetraspora sp. NBRC 13810]GLW08126.1 transcriptional regulator [Microtetraspora sp. NBRC 13810]
MRASRLVSILLLLQTRERMTAQELAARLEVSERTIYRDVQSLSAAGVPVYGEAGHEGGYRLVEGYRTRLTGLTTAEAESLFLTGLPGAADDLGLGEAVAEAQLKLMAALPAELRERAGRLRERFHLDTPSWYHDPDPTPHLPAVADAVWHQRRLRLSYRRWEAPHEVTRTVEPHGVVLKAGRWYLVARRAEGFRTYRVSRIRELEPLEETFDRAEGFDLTGYWRAYLDDFDTRRHRDRAVLRLSPGGLRRLPDLAEPAVARAARETAERDPDGWTRVTVPVESPEQAVRDLLRLGPDAEVLAPAGLRARMAETLAAMSRYYDRDRDS